jgi:hypothetical protein
LKLFEVGGRWYEEWGRNEEVVVGGYLNQEACYLK